MLVEFCETNSGGGRWLSSKQWELLKENGWRLGQYNHFVFNEQGNYKLDLEGLPTMKGDIEEPMYAFKQFDSVQDAVNDWERLTGEDSEEAGCPCCGQPYNFSEC